jgi:hypothetical protein
VGQIGKMKRTKTISGEKSSGEKMGSKGSGSEPVGKVAVLAQVHLWTAGQDGGEPEGLGVPPPALAMVADMLQVQGGELCNGPAGSIAASFAEPGIAVNAARKVQRLVQGFAREWKGGVLGGCTALTRADEGAEKVDVAMLRDAAVLKQTHPGQVVLLGGLCDVARRIPGLEFQALGAAGKNGGRQTVYLLPPRRMEGYVEEAFEPGVAAQASAKAARAVPEPAMPMVTPRPPAYMLPASPPGGRSSAVIPVAGAASSAMPIAASGVVGVAQAATAEGVVGREEKARGSFTRWAVIGGVAAAVVAGVLMFTPIFKKAPAVVAPTPPQEPAESRPTVPPPPEPPAGGEPGQLDSKTDKAQPQPPASSKSKKNETARGKTTPPADKSGDQPLPEKSSSILLSAAEINREIEHAERDSGDGNYDKAIEEYRFVLKHDPGNDLAKRGLQRAEHNKPH